MERSVGAQLEIFEIANECTREMCEHKLDEMGCSFIMPGEYQQQDVFQTCDADVAYPPGVFFEGENSYSSFAQRYTGTITEGGQQTVYTIGDTATPSSAQMTPSSSNCQTQSNLNVPKQTTSTVTGDDGKPSETTTTNGQGEGAQGGGDSGANTFSGLIGVVSASSIAVLAATAIFI